MMILNEQRYLGLSSTSSGTPSSHSHHHHSSHHHHLQQQQPHHYPAPHLLPHHFHYPSSNSWATPASSVTSRRLLGDRAESESTISGSSERPTKFRVSLYDFEKPNLLTTTPDSPLENGSYFRSTNGASNPINRSPPSTTATIRSLALSTTIDQSSISQTRGAQLEMDRRKESTDSGVDNPFRPGGELSREAETIVNLIKEGKPITPTTPTKDLTDSSRTLTPNGNNNSSSSNGSLKEKQMNAVNLSNNKLETTSKKSPTGNGMNGSTPKSPTGLVEVQRTTIVPPSEAPSQAEPVVLKKKPKCKCCVIQ